MLGIEFEFESSCNQPAEQSEEEFADESAIPIPENMLEPLRDAAEQFNATRLKKCCESMEATDHNGHRAARYIRKLVEQGDFEKISDFLNGIELPERKS